MKWAIANNKVIEQKNPITWLAENNFLICSKHPITWAIENKHLVSIDQKMLSIMVGGNDIKKAQEIISSLNLRENKIDILNPILERYTTISKYSIASTEKQSLEEIY